MNKLLVVLAALLALLLLVVEFFIFERKNRTISKLDIFNEKHA